MRPLSSAFVLVDEPAQHVAPSDADPFGRRSRVAPRLRRLEFETPMGPGLVVVGGVAAKHVQQMTAAEHEHPVQTLHPRGADPPLGVSVRLRSPDRSLDDPRALGAEHVVEGTGELRVPIPDHVANASKRLPIARLRACWVTHAESGFLVTPRTVTRRVAMWIANNTYNV